MKEWGFWTTQKLNVLDLYLRAFATATKRARKRVYLDLFAGELYNKERVSKRKIKGSSLIALEIEDPEFEVLRFFELEEKKSKKLNEFFRREHPNRDTKVYEGDCNETIFKALEGIRKHNRAPTFAFIDPYALEIKWNTIAAIAGYRNSNQGKAELLINFAQPMFNRLLSLKKEPKEKWIKAIDDLYGTDKWQEIYEERRKGGKSAEATSKYLKLMLDRLENVLGYKHTIHLRVPNENNCPVYYLIFASDHDAGENIMGDVYKKAEMLIKEARKKAIRIRNDVEKGIMELPLKNLYANVSWGERDLGKERDSNSLSQLSFWG